MTKTKKTPKKKSAKPAGPPKPFTARDALQALAKEARVATGIYADNCDCGRCGPCKAAKRLDKLLPQVTTLLNGMVIPGKPESNEGWAWKHRDAVADLKKILLEGTPEGTECYVYSFYDVDGGYRVAEVSWTRGSGGSSVMRSAPECLDIIAACEDYVLNHGEKPYRPTGWTSDIDERADAEWRLRQLLKPGPTRDEQDLAEASKMFHVGEDSSGIYDGIALVGTVTDDRFLPSNDLLQRSERYQRLAEVFAEAHATACT